MKNLTVPILILQLIVSQLLQAIPLQASTYYFSSSQGNDNNTIAQAQQPATAWQSLAKLNAVLSSLHAGDSVLFKKDDSFYGSLDITISGTASAPVVFSAYGSGKDPVLTGLTAISGWSAAGKGLWQTSVQGAASMIHIVLVNGLPAAIGRYPNSNAANAGYLPISNASGAGSITGSALPPGNWNNSEVVIRKAHWVLDRNQVTAASGNTIQYLSESGYNAAKNYGYFLQNNPATLDQAGEWCFDRNTHQLTIMTGGAAPAAVEASTTEQLISIRNQQYIVFSGLVFKGANQYAFNIDNGGNIKVQNCSMLYTGNTAVHITQSQNISLQQLIIDYSNNTACDISNTTGLVVSNNNISNTGTIPGSGVGDSGSYEALLLSGDNQLIEGNIISVTGYIPITFSGNNIVIHNNFISRFGFVKDDGAGIYSWNNSQQPPVHHDRLIDRNIIVDGTGAPDGTEDHKSAMNGIYMDDNTDHVSIRNNSMANCSQYGFFIHNAHDLIIDSNTCFNNNAQAAFIHDNIAALIPLRNISFTNNICFSKTGAERVVIFESIDDDLAAEGTFDQNYYCRPLDEQSSIQARWKTGSGLYDLESWQPLFNKDASSQKTPFSIKPYHTDALIGPNMYANGNFNTDISNLYVFSASGNAQASWSNSSPLTGGALKIVFNNVPDNRNHGSVIIGIGAVIAGHTYLVKYDAAGGSNRYVEAYFRKSLAPYNDLTERKLSRVYPAKTSCEVVFTATATESNASLGLDIAEQSNPVYIDNLQVTEARVTLTNPDDSIRFVYNNTGAPASFSLDGQYINVRNAVFSGSISLPAFSSEVLLKKSLALLPVVFSSFTATKSGNTVLLQWSTAGSSLNSMQQIERSSDGMHFSKIGERQVTANSNGYTFSDLHPVTNNYYRIRYVNDNRSYGYSQVLYVHFSPRDRLADNDALQVMPNPAVSIVHVVLDNYGFTPCKMLLKTAAGTTVKAMQLMNAATAVDISFLPHGTYVICVLLNNRTISRCFTKA